MKLPNPAGSYNPRMEIERNRQIEQADGQNRKQGRDVEVGRNKLVLRSPDGARWSITVSNAGAISAEPL